MAADILAAMATTNDLKNGMVLKLDGQLWQVMWFQHHKPGKGGAVVRTKLRARRVAARPSTRRSTPT